MSSEANGRLHEAAKRGDLAGVRAALAEGAEIDTAGEAGWTPLLRAIAGEHILVSEYLVSRGCDVNLGRREFDARRDQALLLETPLTLAVNLGQAGLVGLLLRHGADPNLEPYSGESPLRRSLFQDDAKIAALLRNAGADFSSGEAEFLEYMLVHREWDSAAASLRAGIRPHWQENDELRDLLFVLVEANQTEVLELILRTGFPATDPGQDEETALHLAARLDRADAAKVLIAGGAPVDATDHFRRTPLYVACLEIWNQFLGKPENPGSRPLGMIELLVKEGADPEFESAWPMIPRTPMALAKAMRDRELEGILRRE